MNQNLGATFVANLCRVLGAKKINCLMVAVTAFGLIGCGGDDFKPPLGLVSGSVTINGVPAPDLKVTFEPQPQVGAKSLVGSGSTAITDAEGNFELQYEGAGNKGAVVGKHLVRIESAAGGGPAGGANAVALVTIPQKYNINSTLNADVATGNNPPLKFELQVPKP
jgi:hypothetical protein